MKVVRYPGVRISVSNVLHQHTALSSGRRNAAKGLDALIGLPQAAAPPFDGLNLLIFESHTVISLKILATW